MTLTPLLPVRHKQGDFFIADIFDNLPIKDDMASMEHPLFTLSKKKDMRHLKYQNGDISVEMQPSGIGLPNIMDKDILLYCASVMMEKINNGEIPPKTIRLTLNDILIATNRHTNDRGYKYIKEALKRLAGCLVITNIKTGRTGQKGKGFHLIDGFQYVESTRVKKRNIGLEITLSDWFYNSLIAKEVLTISKEYFRLRSPLERRLYEIARKHDQHMKKEGRWSISMEKLQLKTGSASTTRHFKQLIKKLSTSNHIPDYQIHVNDNNTVRFEREGKAEIIDQDNDIVTDEPLFLDVELTAALSEKNIEKAKKAAGRADIYGLWADFREWNMEKQNQLDNVNAAFIGWCKKKRQ